MSDFSELFNKYISQKNMSDLTLAKKVQAYAEQHKIKLNCNVNREMFHQWRTTTQRPHHKNCIIVDIITKVLELDDSTTKNLLKVACCNQTIYLPETSHLLVTPPAKKIRFIHSLFDKFSESYPIPLILLTQQNFPLMTHYFCSHVVQHYNEGRYHFIRLPDYAEEDRFYERLGQVFGFANVSDGCDFQDVFVHSIRKENTPYFCFIHRFGHVSDQIGHNLASILRSVYDETHQQLHLILVGGQKLADLIGGSDTHSLLNDANIMDWQEWEYEDVQLYYRHLFSEGELPSEIAQYFLDITGAHLKLLTSCCSWYQKGDTDVNNFSTRLLQQPDVQALFNAQMRNRTQIDYLKELLSTLQVSENTILVDEFLNQLYWKNLLIKRNNGYYWRCETIRQAGLLAIN